MEKPVIIFGTGPLSLAALNIFSDNNIVVFGLLDDDKKLHGTEIMDATILSTTDDEEFLQIIGAKCEAFIAFENISIKKSIVKLLNEKRKVMPVNALHGNSHIAKSAEIGHGNLIDAGTVIGAQSVIGNHCILLSNSTVESMVTIGDYVQLGPGVTIGSGVSIGDDAFVGAGVVIVSGVTIGKGARIGAGSVVVSDVKKGDTVFGNPAKTIETPS